MISNLYFPLLIFLVGVVIYVIGWIVYSKRKKDDDISVKELNTIFYRRRPDKYLK